MRGPAAHPSPVQCHRDSRHESSATPNQSHWEAHSGWQENGTQPPSGGQHTRPSRKEMPFALHFAREQASISAGPRPERMSPWRPCLHHARCGAFSWFSGLYPAFGPAGVLSKGLTFGRFDHSWWGQEWGPADTWRGQEQTRSSGHRFGRFREAAQQVASLHARSHGSCSRIGSFCDLVAAPIQAQAWVGAVGRVRNACPICENSILPNS